MDITFKISGVEAPSMETFENIKMEARRRFNKSLNDRSSWRVLMDWIAMGEILASEDPNTVKSKIRVD